MNEDVPPIGDHVPKVAIVTGASRGIGRACAVNLAMSGFTVVAIARNRAELGVTVARCTENGGRALSCAIDLTERKSIRSAVDAIESEVGPIEVLVNCAGINNASEAFLNVSEKQWRDAFEVNVTAMFSCTQEVIKRMLPRRRGSIVNVSSSWGLTAAPLPYGATKWAVEGFTKGLAREFTREGIRVNSVAPGATVTSMNGFEEGAAAPSAELPMGRFAMPQEIAAAVGFLVSEGATYVSGATLVVDGSAMNRF